MTISIILSRKGFDSSAGKVASPIFPDGTMVSLPIPRERPYPREGYPTYDALSFNEKPLARIVDDLVRRRCLPTRFPHVDPDLRACTLPRMPGWRPVFGQRGASQSHLVRHGVAVDDLFLFFGWFRRVEDARGRWRFVRGERDLHVIFGWLQIGQVRNVRLRRDADRIPEWAKYHPHWQDRSADRYGDKNTIYISREKLAPGGVETGLAGAGVFPYRDKLCLTKSGSDKRGVWRLPEWFYPDAGKPQLTYHRNMKRWSKDDGHAILQSASRGQEFVLDCAHYPEAIAWVRELIAGDR